MRHDRVRAWGGAAVLSLVLVGSVTSASVADDSTDRTAPTEQEVAAAQAAASDKARDVHAVRADLVLANQRLDDSAVQAAVAAEAYNGAQWRLEQARAAARAAELRAEVAGADVRRQQEVYSAAIVRSYELAPEVTGLSAMAGSTGIEDMIERGATMANAEEALDGRYDAFRASATLAEVARDQAEEAREEAARLEREARAARDSAAAAADAALSQSQAVAAEKSQLIAELADLQGVSVQLAERRQVALEEAAAEAAAEAAEREASEAAREAAEKAAADAAATKAAEEAAAKAAEDAAKDEPAPSSAPTSTPAPTTPPTTPPTTAAPAAPTPAPTTAAPPTAPTSKPTRTPTTAPAPSAPPTTATPTPPPPSTPAPATPPPPSSGAGAAIAFATAQLGDAYRWGAAGPDAWDCSGLTQGAWAAGGRSLPHYSVAQYTGSTPVAAGALQPGDLVFWGSSSNASSIYHVALYVGGGQIIHAPRTGRPVVKESMYGWRAPNFFARP